MKVGFCVLLICCSGLWLVSGSVSNLPQHARGGVAWMSRRRATDAKEVSRALVFSQLVDHYNVIDLRRFGQRYWIDDASWRKGAEARKRTHPGDLRKPTPRYNMLFVCGAERCEGTSAAEGFVTQLAERFLIRIFTIEHRFYGESVPDGNISTESLENFLDIKQTLGDLNRFIGRQTALDAEPYGRVVPWIVTGSGAYAGGLATWLAEAYGSIMTMTYASSPALKAVLDFWQYDAQIVSVLSSECAQVLRDTTAELEQRLNRSTDSATAVKALFGASHLSDEDFLYMAADSAALAVQSSHKSTLCNFMLRGRTAKLRGTNRNSNPLSDVFANFTSWFWGPRFGSSCVYDTQCLSDPSRTEGWNARAWAWQQCHELGWFPTAGQELNLRTFGLSSLPLRSRRLTLTYFLARCSRIFGRPSSKPDVDTFNLKYGGTEPFAVRCIFTSAKDDPWRAVSVNRSISLTEPLVRIECDDCSQSVEMANPTPSDLPALRSARQDIVSIFDQWLRDFKR